MVLKNYVGRFAPKKLSAETWPSDESWLVAYRILNTKPETMGVVRNGLFPPPVALYPPFQRDDPTRHIMGDVGCAFLG